MFFELKEKHADNIALVHNDERLTYAQLQQACDKACVEMGAHRQLIFLQAENSVASIIFYLAALRGGHCLMLLANSLNATALQLLIEKYQPNSLIREDQLTRLHHKPFNADPRVSLLLSTSGSTGAAKQVALSSANLEANVQSITQYLPILETDKTLLTLPMFYSYGLSVINSHLAVGACIVLTDYSMVNREFWNELKQQKISSIAGVPYQYETIIRLRFTTMDLPALRYFTQAGGKLNPLLVAKLGEFAQQSSKQFFVMYGQTEATARMAYLSPDKVCEKPNSIGNAIPGGEFKLVDDCGETVQESNKTGELYYRGQNVMLGYVNNITELESLQPLDWLATGDLAYFDQQSDFFIVGRRKRFIKVFGQRIGLDDVEDILKRQGIDCLCCGIDDKLVIAAMPAAIELVQPLVCEQLKLHPSVIHTMVVDELPINANGKKDYALIMQRAGLHDV